MTSCPGALVLHSDLARMIVVGDKVEEVYTGIVGDIAKLARNFAKLHELASGPDALLAFADHLEGIVAAVGVDQFRAVRVSVRDETVEID